MYGCIKNTCIYIKGLCTCISHCYTLQYNTIHCNTIYFTMKHLIHFSFIACRQKQFTLQHIETHCNTLQHTATHCNTMHHIATNCNTLQHIPCCSKAFDNSLPFHHIALSQGLSNALMLQGGVDSALHHSLHPTT